MKRKYPCEFAEGCLDGDGETFTCDSNPDECEKYKLALAREESEVDEAPTCRDCVLVKVDEESGGDIDGCLRDDIIDEIASRFPDKKEELEKLRCEEDGKGIAINFMDFQPENHEEFLKCADLFWKMRERMYHLTKLHLLYKIEKLKEAKLIGINATTKMPNLR